MPSKEFLERCFGDTGEGLLFEKPDGTYYRAEKDETGKVVLKKITEEEYKKYLKND